ncbi:MAG: NAD(P)H-dependent oxidoreductase [Candidatus Paceibacterota bacterium]
MHDNKLFIPILLGTVRKERKSEHVARLLFSRLSEHPEIETYLFDPRDMDLPMNDEGQKLKFKNPEYRNAIVRADGLIIVSPEYNHSFPGSLKRVLDIVLTEYTHRAVGLVGVSAGGFGGTRVIEQLVNVVRELGLVVTSSDLNFSKVGDIFNEDGKLQDDSVHERIDQFVTELVWMSKVLRWGRENLPSRFDKRLEELQTEWEEKIKETAEGII